MVKSAVTKILIFITAAAIMAAALVVVALIPKSAIRQQMLESAQHLASEDMYDLTVPDVVASCTDHYSDSILLNIIYCYDSSRPASSVMNSAYYHDPVLEENENFLEAVTSDREPNLQYLRYWHGSALLLRPLLTLIPVQKIYILNAVIIAVLAAALITQLIRAGHKLLALAFSVSMVMVRIWFVPFSLEYFWNFMIMFIACIIAVRLAGCGSTGKITSFFLLTGMVTNFLDFLTTETITLLMPLLIIVSIRNKNREKIKDQAVLSVRSAISWLCGYAFMWMAKWALAAAVLRKTVLPLVTGHIVKRLGMNADMNSFGYYIGAVTRNFSCLFPLGHGLWGIIGFGIIVLTGLYFGYVYRKPGHDRRAVLLYASLALVPVIRYLVLHNHSYIHFFFTYRALAPTVLAAVLIIGELMEGADGNEQ
ncbi:MAG: hypothetical protein K6F73_03675 [Lachnospiraceae bacterium]|nr:hypothetical protein [Lachnospiraceae bacterium]